MRQGLFIFLVTIMLFLVPKIYAHSCRYTISTTPIETAVLISVNESGDFEKAILGNRINNQGKNTWTLDPNLSSIDFYENGVFKCPSLYTGGAGKGYELGVKLRGNYNAAPSIYSPQIICNYSFAEKKINEIQFPQYYVTWSITKENVNSSTGTLLNSVSSSIQTLNLPEEVKHFSCPDICLSYPENLSGTYSIVPYSSGLENSNNMQCIYSGKLLAPNPTPNPSAPHDTCDELSVDRIKACGCIPAGIADLTSKAYFILQIIGPVLLLILGGFDMAKAIATQDESAIEKAKKKLVNKFIAAAAIFFVFTIMQFLVNLLAKNATGIIECVDILLNGYVI